MDTGTAILQNKLFSKITTQVKQKNKPIKETSNEKDQNGKKIKKYPNTRRVSKGISMK